VRRRRQASCGWRCALVDDGSGVRFSISEIKKFRNPLRNGKFPKFPKFRLKFKLNSIFLKKIDMISLETIYG
jgi:hypothetical protein